MKYATSLTLIAIGAILTFAITSHPSWLNLHIVGVVLMLVGVVGLVLPRRGAQQEGWLRRRMLVRRNATAPAVSEVEETQYPPYISINPASPPGPDDNEREPGPHPSRLHEPGTDPAAAAPQAGETEVIEEYRQE
jgi:hypothetical protein